MAIPALVTEWCRIDSGCGTFCHGSYYTMLALAGTLVLRLHIQYMPQMEELCIDNETRRVQYVRAGILQCA